MRGKKLFISITLIIILIFIFMPQNVQAGTLMEEMKQQANAWIEAGRTEGENIINDQTLQTKFIPIGQILIAIGTTVLVFVTGIMGIKYITAGPDEKGKLKQQLIGLVVSIIVIYGSVGIWTAVQNIMKSLDI